eukprot:2260958-Heterocapsa_arctica.AAC.1
MRWSTISLAAKEAELCHHGHAPEKCGNFHYGLPAWQAIMYSVLWLVRATSATPILWGISHGIPIPKIQW